MWTKASNYQEYLNEGHLHSSSEYYTKIFARGDENLELAKSNLELFDMVIVAEKNMSNLEKLGWTKESDTTHPTFGDKKRAGILFAKMRWFRLYNYLRKVKYEPPESINIRELNKLDLELYSTYSE